MDFGLFFSPETSLRLHDMLHEALAEKAILEEMKRQ